MTLGRLLRIKAVYGWTKHPYCASPHMIEIGFREQLTGRLFTLVSNRQESQELFTWLLTVNNYNLCE